MQQLIQTQQQIKPVSNSTGKKSQSSFSEKRNSSQQQRQKPHLLKIKKSTKADPRLPPSQSV
jgi:hypothetical protein